MPLTKKTIKKINQDYPQFFFKQGSTFAWSPGEKTIYYNLEEENAPILLLHELSHAILNHTSYTKDITLIDLERTAWSHTVKIARQYKVKIKPKFIEKQLDSYREWLYFRSLCPNCKNNGIQADQHYSCLVCGAKWKSNPAKITELRRYIIKNNSQ